MLPLSCAVHTAYWDSSPAQPDTNSSGQPADGAVCSIQPCAVSITATCALSGHGSVTREEFLAAGGSTADFTRFDADHSGILDKDELEAMAAACCMASEDLRTMDTNADGKVSKEEFVSAGGNEADFDRFDADGSGSLDREELETMASFFRHYQRGRDSGLGLLDALNVAKQQATAEHMGVHR
jgi:hypothetical protein